MGKRGPKTLLTPDLAKKIIRLVNAGAPIPLACSACGVKWNTAKFWVLASSPKAKYEPFKSFQAELEKAKAAWAYAAIMRITKAGKRGDWRADLALLERRLPHYFYLPWRRGQAASGSPLAFVDPLEELAIQAGMGSGAPGDYAAQLPSMAGPTIDATSTRSEEAEAEADDELGIAEDDMDGRSTDELEHYAATGYWPEEMPRVAGGDVVDTDGTDITAEADPAVAAELAKQLGDADAADPAYEPAQPAMARVAGQHLREIPGGQLVESAPHEEPAPTSNVVRLPRIDPLAGRF
jgi:hypothetical protein